MKTYRDHLKTTGAHGTLPIPNRRPVLKSSAIFPCVVQDGLDTRVLYMGYWLLKRNIPEVSLLKTLRDDRGNILFRELQVIDNVRAHEVSVASILRGLEYQSTVFVGSIELEIFSTRDLVFPYPAFVLNYVSEAGSTVVHTTGRVYNDLEDLQENDQIRVAEAGFDIIARPGVEPYFAFVNGTVAVADAEIRMELINADQQRRVKTLELGDLSTYQACFVRFMEDEDREFLGQSKGSVILHHDLKGFFPRFIAGHMVPAENIISLTHTFYDTTQHTSDDAYWTNSDPSRFEDSTIAFPVRIGGDWYTEFVVYPNHSPASMVFDIVLCAATGQRVARIDNVFEVASDEARLSHIDVGALFADSLDAHAAAQDYSAMVIVRSAGPIPARLKFGLNIGEKKGADIPSNICFNARVPDPALLTKPFAFRWAPLEAQGSSILVLTNHSFERDYRRQANIKLKFWSQDHDASIEREVQIPAEGSYWLHLRQDDEIQSFFAGKVGWVTCECDNPFASGWYLMDAGAGVIGADHAF